jgi:hypothetical protein
MRLGMGVARTGPAGLGANEIGRGVAWHVESRFDKARALWGRKKID